MSKMKVFSVSIYGSGRLLGMVIPEGMRAYPKSTWYDYSNAMKTAVAQEYQIATSGRMRPVDVPSVRRAMANQQSPPATDIVLDFSYSHDVDRVKIMAGKKIRTFVCNEHTSRQRDPLLGTSRQIVQAMGQML